VQIGPKEINLTKCDLDQVLPNIQQPLKEYLWLQSRAADLASPAEDVDFCKRFAKFYGIYAARRSKQWQCTFFTLLGELKDRKPSFPDALSALQSATGNLEASFASKLVATHNPSLAVLDDIVLGHLGLKLPYWKSPRRFERVIEVYEDLTKRIAHYIASNEGRRTISQFRAFNESYAKADITDAKIIDLVLWQWRTKIEGKSTRSRGVPDDAERRRDKRTQS